MKTPHDYRKIIEKQREADKREQYIADGLAWGLVIVIIICVLL